MIAAAKPIGKSSAPAAVRSLLVILRFMCVYSRGMCELVKKRWSEMAALAAWRGAFDLGCDR